MNKVVTFTEEELFEVKCAVFKTLQSAEQELALIDGLISESFVERQRKEVAALTSVWNKL